MISNILELNRALLESNISAWLLYVIYALAVLLVLCILAMTFFISRKLADTSNYTMRQLMRVRYSSTGGSFKKLGKRLYFLPKTSNTLFKRIYDNNKITLEKAGIFSDKLLAIMIAVKWVVLPILSVIAGFANKAEGNKAFLIAAFSLGYLELTIWVILRWRIQVEADRFKVASYKLFKFLRNQLSAGVKINKALNSLYTVADDPLLRSRLLLLASHYASTNDIDTALTYITDYYQTLEAKSLALSIKQSIETGRNETGFKQKEKKLFNMYLNVIRKKTQFIMAKYFMMGILYAAVIVLILGYPMWLDLLQANMLIFGN